MPAPGRPPPPITVVVPGRGPVPTELLAVGPPPERPPGLPGRLRALAAAVLVVLGAGVLVAVDQRADRSDGPDAQVAGRPTAGGAVAVEDFPGLRATTQVVVEQALAVQVLLEVRISAAPAPAVHERGSARAVQVRLLHVASDGFDVRLLQRPPPLLLGYVGRFGDGGLEQVVRLSAEVVVADCAVAVAAPRWIRLDLRRGDRGEGPAGGVLVQSSAETVRALDELVRRSCRQPGG